MFFLLLFAYLSIFLLYIFGVNNKKMLWIIPLLMVLPALAYDPIEADMYRGHYADTVRIFSEIDSLRTRGWDAWTPYDNLILSKAYIYGFSLLPNNYFLPCVTVIIFYFVLTLGMIRAGNALNFNNQTTSLAIIVSTFAYTYFDVLTNIRYPLAVVLLFFLLVEDLLYKRHRFLCLLGYIVVANLHQGVLLFVVLRYLCMIPLRYAIISIFFGIIIIFNNFETLISIGLGQDSGLLLSIAEKQQGYIGFDRGFTPAFRITCLMIDVALITCSLYTKKKYKKYIVLLNFGILVSLCGICSAASYTLVGDVIISRMEDMGSLLIGLFFVMVKYIPRGYISSSKPYNTFFTNSLCILCLSCWVIFKLFSLFRYT